MARFSICPFQGILQEFTSPTKPGLAGAEFRKIKLRTKDKKLNGQTREGDYPKSL